ncbi:MAG: hypothetical protein SFW08_04620 [Gemmatimonadaceae bacterium]|nr:hypothetical protein [Gemmatimonadaceae bacterium]
MIIAALVLQHDALRVAIRQSSWRGASLRTRTIPLASADEPAAVIARLVADEGPARRVLVAVGLDQLHVKQVQLPPVARDDKHRMLTVDPPRWFAVPPDASLAIALAPGDDVAFGVSAEWLDRWIAAAEAWGPVERVEAAPLALARQLARSGIRDGVVAVDAAPGESGRMTLVAGRVTQVRRSVHASGAASGTTEPLRAVPDDGFDTARGLLAPHATDRAAALETPAHAARLTRRLRWRLGVAVAAAAAALLLTVLAWDNARARRLAWLEAEIARARVIAAPTLAQLDSIRALDAEVALIDGVASTRGDVLAPLGALSDQLPSGAVAQRIRLAAGEGQIDGSAPSAARVLDALTAGATFRNVRFLGPTARVAGGEARGATPRETYSIGLALR